MLRENMVLSMHPHVIAEDGSCLYMQETWRIGNGRRRATLGAAAQDLRRVSNFLKASLTRADFRSKLCGPAHLKTKVTCDRDPGHNRSQPCSSLPSRLIRPSSARVCSAPSQSTVRRSYRFRSGPGSRERWPECARSCAPSAHVYSLGPGTGSSPRRTGTRCREWPAGRRRRDCGGSQPRPMSAGSTWTLAGHAEDLQADPLIHADEARAAGYTGAGVTVGILDSGMLLNHPDLQDALLAQQCYVHSPGTCPNGLHTQSGAGAGRDDNGHGTNVAGIVTGNGTKAPTGVAPSSKLVIVRVLAADGSFADTAQVISGLQFILNHPEYRVKVINMSLGRMLCSPGNATTRIRTSPRSSTHCACRGSPSSPRAGTRSRRRRWRFRPALARWWQSVRYTTATTARTPRSAMTRPRPIRSRASRTRARRSTCSPLGRRLPRPGWVGGHLPTTERRRPRQRQRRRRRISCRRTRR